MTIAANNAALYSMCFIKAKKERKMSNVQHAVRMNMSGCFLRPAYSFTVRKPLYAVNIHVRGNRLLRMCGG